jgi:hypothetical protein
MAKDFMLVRLAAQCGIGEAFSVPKLATPSPVVLAEVGIAQIIYARYHRSRFAGWRCASTPHCTSDGGNALASVLT